MKITQNGRKRVTAMIMAVLLLLGTAVPAAAETFSAIVTAGSMTVYSDAKLTKKLATLEKDTVVRITAYSGKSASISYRGRTGYAKVSDMQAVEDVADKAVTKSDCTVYQTPSASARSAKVKKGAKLYVLASSDEWAEVEKDGAVGYIRVEDLVEVDDSWKPIVSVATPAPEITIETGMVKDAKMPVYKSASTGSKKLGSLKQGQEVNVISWDDQWAYIELNGNYGYCAVKSLRLESESGFGDDDEEETVTYQTATVKDSKMTVYKKASSSSTKLGTLKKGRVVNLVSRDGKWAYIELNGNYGYCKASALEIGSAPEVTPAPGDAPSLDGSVKRVVTVESLTVYKTASTSANKLLILDEGDVVNAVRWNDDWAYIEYEGINGFCDLAGLAGIDTEPTTAAPEEPTLEGATTATVAEESVMVYREPGDTDTALGALMWGDQVNIISISDNWAYIEKDGKYGYISATALTATPADPDDLPTGYKTADFEATVISPDAKGYESASTKSAATALPLGDMVMVIAYSSDLEWACVASGNGMLYVPIKHLSRTTYDTVTGGSEMQTLLKALLSYGYYDGPASGDSSGVVTAIKRFQAACGLDETGEADQTLQRILYGGYAPADPILSTALSSGDTGDSVSRMQMRLYTLGYLTRASSLDGDYGTTTATAVGLFQKGNGISVTGTASVATLKAMYSANAVSRPSSVKAADDTSSTSGSSVVTPSGTVTLSSTYVTTMPSSLKSSTSSFSSGMSSGQKLEYVIYVAQSNLGKPYVYGATGTSSFDCSGLTQYSFKKAGVNLKRTAYSQGYDSSYSKISSISDLKRGDLIFFNTISDSDLCDHVGIYLGGKCFIHASSGGHKVVVSSVASGYYNRVFSWGRRILK